MVNSTVGTFGVYRVNYSVMSNGGDSSAFVRTEWFTTDCPCDIGRGFPDEIDINM